MERDPAVLMNADLARAKRNDQGDYECEVWTTVAEGEKEWKGCKKYPGHTQFIPVQEFSIKNLPEPFQDDEVFEYVRLLSERTVRLIVKYTSEMRPKGYPFAKYGGRFLSHTGSGLVYCYTYPESFDGDGDVVGGEGDGGVVGGEGDGDVVGGEGDGDVVGGEGDGDVVGGEGDEDVIVEEGDGDVVVGEGDGDVVGEKGDGDVVGGEGDEDVIGEEGDEDVVVGEGDKDVVGEKGDEDVVGGEGDEDVVGGEGDGDVVGEEGDGDVSGEEGDEDVVGEEGDEDVVGGEGDVDGFKGNTDDGKGDTDDGKGNAVDGKDDSVDGKRDDDVGGGVAHKCASQAEKNDLEKIQKIDTECVDFDEDEESDDYKIYEYFDHKGTPCPCEECSYSDTPQYQWGHVYIHTAKHVVFDKLEAEWTVAELNFDIENDTQSLKKLHVVDISHEDLNKGDWTTLTCVTHDRELYIKLYETEKRVSELRDIIHEKYWESPARLALVVSHPHGWVKKVTVGEWTERTVKESSLDGDELVEYRYNTATCKGSSGAPVLVLGMRGPDPSFKPWLSHHHVHCGSTQGDDRINFSGIGEERRVDLDNEDHDCEDVVGEATLQEASQ